MIKNKTVHIPVLLKETTSLLVKGKGVYVDCTINGGGHAKEILKADKNIFLIGIDLDEEALERAKENLKEFEGRYALYKANFADIDEVLKSEGIGKVEGILFDLGISMYQLKGNRGFSFEDESFLDMRVDRSQKLTAYKVINEYKEKDIAYILKNYGQERFASWIAKEIVYRRSKKPIETAKELADIVSYIYSKKGMRTRIHPATKTFMAFRIYVNRELENLEVALRKSVNLLRIGGRLAVITFHSLEDRIVKRYFMEKEKEGIFNILTKKPIKPNLEERRMNPASRSAKLRVGERIG